MCLPKDKFPTAFMMCYIFLFHSIGLCFALGFGFFVCLLSCLETCKLIFPNDSAIAKAFYFLISKEMCRCLICSGCCNKRPSTEWLINQKSVSHHANGKKSKIQALANVVSREGLLPGSYVLMCGRSKGVLWGPCIWALIPSWGSTLMTYLPSEGPISAYHHIGH